MTTRTEPFIAREGAPERTRDELSFQFVRDVKDLAEGYGDEEEQQTAASLAYDLVLAQEDNCPCCGPDDVGQCLDDAEALLSNFGFRVEWLGDEGYAIFKDQ